MTIAFAAGLRNEIQLLRLYHHSACFTAPVESKQGISHRLFLLTECQSAHQRAALHPNVEGVLQLLFLQLKQAGIAAVKIPCHF